MNLQQLRAMHQAGMWLGAHSVSHPVMSTLSDEEQAFEIQESLSFIETVLANEEVHTHTCTERNLIRL